MKKCYDMRDWMTNSIAQGTMEGRYSYDIKKHSQPQRITQSLNGRSISGYNVYEDFE